MRRIGYNSVALSVHRSPVAIASDNSICYTRIANGDRPCWPFACRLDIEQRLDALAKKTGRTKSFYAREAILRQIEDIEDDYLARKRLARGGSRVSLESLERDLKKTKAAKKTAR